MKHLLRIVLLCSLLLCACSKSIETAVINADGMTVRVDVRDGHRALLAQLGDWELADSTLFKVLPSEYTFRPGEVLAVEIKTEL